jgi:cold shock CspA family protein
MNKSRGLIKFIDLKKEIGFIALEDGRSKDIFFRLSGQNESLEVLKSGTLVEFKILDGEAIEIRLLWS